MGYITDALNDPILDELNDPIEDEIGGATSVQFDPLSTHAANSIVFDHKALPIEFDHRAYEILFSQEGK